MCGIAGIVTHQPGGLVNRPTLEAMTRTLAHRGPDGEDVLLLEGAGLGHRRLAIIDIAGGHQPMQSADGRYSLTYNGEIYNFRDLRQRLEGLGYRFRTQSDSEVVLCAFAHWGSKCLGYLRGMFAFAVWDHQERRLTIARDRLGEKPLYYAKLPGGDFIFASELKALRQHPGLSVELDLEAVEDFLGLGYVPDPKSIYKTVRKLPPGRFATFTHGNSAPNVQQYWKVPLGGLRHDRLDPEELIHNLRGSVAMRMVADVPIGGFLSGGVDSSAIIGLMSEVSAQAVESCAIGSEDPEFDESGVAETVADHFGCRHRMRLASPTDAGLLDLLSDVYDEPFADVSALPTYRVCGLAAERVKVCLSGDGGDELFAGYRRYRYHLAEERLRQRLPAALRQAVFAPMGRLYPKLDWAPQFLRAKSTLESLGADSAEAYFNTVSRGPDRDRRPLMSQRFLRHLAGYHPARQFQHWAGEVAGAHPLSVIQYIDFNSYLPAGILTKVDRASMAHSLEVRIPLLDHEFVTWGLAGDPDQLIDMSDGKKVFKASLRGFVPDDVLDRPKQGFTVPLADWMRGELRPAVEALTKSEALLDTGLFRRQRLARMIDEHANGRRDHSQMLWSMMVLDSNLRRHPYQMPTG